MILVWRLLIKILKKYGVEEFWCNSDLNLALDYLGGELYIDCKDSGIKLDLYSLFNEGTDKYTLANIFDFSEDNNIMLSNVLNEMEKRIMINN